MKLDVRCRTCGGDNYARHKYCGWCGVEMGALSGDEITDHAAVGVPGLVGDATSPGQVAAEPTAVRPIPSTHADSLVVAMLGELSASGKSRSPVSGAVLYRLELGEPFDVDGPNLQAPGTFTATVEGLRLDSLGSLEGVYRRVTRDQKPVAYRRLRVIRELGTFQALAPGETIPLGCMAILDHVLVRIEPG
ncbi:MAG: hypothetical protein ACE37F_00345 [Nannocystaceae bacterium]|nr:hypothetical protein [bacterium]